MKDTFLTQRYRSGHIHSCYDRDQGREVVTLNMPDGTTRAAKSVHGAKCILARAEKGAGN